MTRDQDCANKTSELTFDISQFPALGGPVDSILCQFDGVGISWIPGGSIWHLRVNNGIYICAYVFLTGKSEQGPLQPDMKIVPGTDWE